MINSEIFQCELSRLSLIVVNFNYVFIQPASDLQSMYKAHTRFLRRSLHVLTKLSRNAHAISQMFHKHCATISGNAHEDFTKYLGLKQSPPVLLLQHLSDILTFRKPLQTFIERARQVTHVMANKQYVNNGKTKLSICVVKASSNEDSIIATEIGTKLMFIPR